MILKFHKHKYRCKVWRLVHEPGYEPLTILMGCECRVYGKRKLFHCMPRNQEWELTHKDLFNNSMWDFRWEDKK